MICISKLEYPGIQRIIGILGMLILILFTKSKTARIMVTKGILILFYVNSFSSELKHPGIKGIIGILGMLILFLFKKSRTPGIMVIMVMRGI